MPQPPTSRFIVATASSVVVLLLAAILIVSVAATTHASPARAATVFLVVEAVVVAVAVPLLHSTIAAEARGACALAFCLLFAVVCLLLSRWAAPLSWAALASCQVVLAAFAALVWALAAGAQTLGATPPWPQLVASAVALAMVGDVFFANPIVETCGPAVRLSAVALALWANPWLAAAGSILEADPVRTAALYRFSVIPEYAFRYPAAGLHHPGARALVLAGVYLACACAVWLAASGLARLRTIRQPRLNSSSASD